MQRFFAILLGTIFLASCSGVTPLQYTYQPPLDQDGALCIKNHCEKSQAQCESIGYVHHPECRPTENNPQPGGKECRTIQHDCLEQYASCYAMCGGKVFANGECMSCDATYEQQADQSSQVEE